MTENVVSWVLGQVLMQWEWKLHWLRRESNMSQKKRTWWTRVLFCLRWIMFIRKFLYWFMKESPFVNTLLSFNTLMKFDITYLLLCPLIPSFDLKPSFGLIRLTKNVSSLATYLLLIPFIFFFFFLLKILSDNSKLFRKYLQL